MFPSSRFVAASALRARRPLTNDELRQVAPSVFAEAAHDSRSARYAYIATIEILNGLRREGFEVFDARQARTRLPDRTEHTKHLLRLRHASHTGRALAGDSVPEILLLNSHDGSSSYQMMGGIFRFICANCRATNKVVGFKVAVDPEATAPPG